LLWEWYRVVLEALTDVSEEEAVFISRVHVVRLKTRQGRLISIVLTVWVAPRLRWPYRFSRIRVSGGPHPHNEQPEDVEGSGVILRR
jgi:hypothetical protein